MAKRRSKGPKCVVCGKGATMMVFWHKDGFSMRPIRSKRGAHRKTRTV